MTSWLLMAAAGHVGVLSSSSASCVASFSSCAATTALTEERVTVGGVNKKNKNRDANAMWRASMNGGKARRTRRTDGK